MRTLQTALSLAVFAALVFFSVSALADDDLAIDQETLQQIATDLQKDLDALPPASLEVSVQVDSVLTSVASSLSFAAEALANGNPALAMDAMSVVKGSLSVANSKLPSINAASNAAEQLEAMEGRGLTKADVDNVQGLLHGIAKAELQSLPDLNGIADRLAENNFDVASLNDSLGSIGSSLDEATRSISFDLSNIENLANALESASLSGASLEEISRAAGQAAAAMGADLQSVANAVAASIAAGVNVDLDAAAQGMGFTDFGAAVDAYNAEYGTNYTEAQAREALGQ